MSTEKTALCPENGQERPTLAVYPLADLRRGDHRIPGYNAPHDDPDDPIPTVDLWGHCALFCADDRPATSGLSVADHGPWCQSLLGAGVAGLDYHRARVSLYAGLVAPYTHGIYRRADIRSLGHERTAVRLTVVGAGIPADPDDEGANVHLSIGEVRRLAAGLLYLCDQADGLDRQLNDATRERRAGD